MKKIFAVICIISLFTGMLSACTPENSGSSPQANGSEPVSVSVAVIKGPSSIGMIKLMDEANSGEISTNDFSFELSASADEVVPKIVQGKIDIAAVPPNLASVLYNSTQGGIQVIAVGTLGMLYVVENGNTVNSLEDLRGKTIYAGFKGKSPEYDLSYILKENGIDPEKDLVIEWKSEHTECVAALTTNENAVAILPQPFVTIAQTSNSSIRVAIDLNGEWNKLQETAENPSALITGVVVARKEFIEQNPGAIDDFLNRYAASAEYVNSNVNEAAALVGKYEIFPEAIAQKAIPFCNITYIDGQEMKDKLPGYLSILFAQNPQSVGGALPNEDFYFVR